jgi:hypothetical protein
MKMVIPCCLRDSQITYIAALMALLWAVGPDWVQGQTASSRDDNESPWLLMTSLDASQRTAIASMATNQFGPVPDGIIVQRLRPDQFQEAKDVFEKHPHIYHKAGLDPYFKPQETPSLCWAACLQPILAANGFSLSQREIERLILNGNDSGQGIVLSNLAYQIFTAKFE